MNNELNNMHNPLRLRLFWVAVYAGLVIMALGIMWFVAEQVRTHSLPSGQVMLSIPYSKYVVGESISFTLKNNYNSPIYVTNNCPYEPLAVYRFESGQWIRQHDTTLAGNCPNEDRQEMIGAGESVSGNFDSWYYLFKQPGKYRVVAFVEYYNSLPYQEIEVVAAKSVSAQTSTSTSTNSSSSSSNSSSPATTYRNNHETETEDD